MPAKRKQTFAEIVTKVLATPQTPLDVRAGMFNATGQFFDPSGVHVEKGDSITPLPSGSNRTASSASAIPTSRDS